MGHNILMAVCDGFAIIFLVLSINEYRKASNLFRGAEKAWIEVAMNMNSEETVKEED